MNPILTVPDHIDTLAYGRASTDHQPNSIAIQEAACRAWYEGEYARATYSFTQPFQIGDDDVSGKIQVFQRPHGRLIKELAEAGRLKHLIIHKVDRLGRNARDMLAVWEFLLQHQVKLYVVHDGIFPNNPMGKFWYQFLSIMAEAERDRIHERVTAGINRRFEKGLVQGQLPYGARAVHPETGADVVPVETVDALGRPREQWPAGTLQVEHPEEALWVRQMATWRAEGMGWDKIARQLAEHGVSTKHGGKWSGGKVQRILTGRWVRTHLLDEPESATGAAAAANQPLPLAA